MFGFLLLWGSLLCGCGGGSVSGGGAGTPPAQQAATPTITTTAAQNGAVIVTLADSTSGATMYYTLDGSTPNNTSQVYQAPFLVASNITVNAIAAEAPAYLNSNVATKAFTPGIASGTLVWSDEFANTGGANIAPSASTWTYDTGLNCCGNNELETYCSPASNAAPCSSSNPNAYVGTDGYLHIVAMQSTPGTPTYTSARLKSQGMFSFMYGRIEARIKIPESQGMWPAFWMLGNNITTLSWPGCGELDIMEHIDGSNPPFSVGATPPGFDWIAGSVHGGTTASHADGSQRYNPTAFSAAGWHTYGMIWQKGQVQYYVDDPTNPYATFTTSSFPAGVWPFDVGPQFVILNLAVGGDWPGNPDATTAFPSEMTVDYVRIYTN
jgi:beta-glucanase (GH16 family)